MSSLEKLGAGILSLFSISGDGVCYVVDRGSGPPDLPDIFKVLPINPQALDTVKQLNETIAFGNSPLGRVREEAIATVVAVANRCRFGALTHSGFLRQYTGDQQTAANMLVNHHMADLDPADRQMLDFAVQVTTKPSTLTSDDIENLRKVGFDDQEILSIILVTCLVNFMNRLADSLGIDIPASYQKAVEKWLNGPAGRQPWLMRPVSQRTRNPAEGAFPEVWGPTVGRHLRSGIWKTTPAQAAHPAHCWTIRCLAMPKVSN